MLEAKTVGKRVARIVTRGPKTFKSPSKCILCIFLCFQVPSRNLSLWAHCHSLSSRENQISYRRRTPSTVYRRAFPSKGLDLPVKKGCDQGKKGGIKKAQSTSPTPGARPVPRRLYKKLCCIRLERFTCTELKAGLGHVQSTIYCILKTWTLRFH